MKTPKLTISAEERTALEKAYRFGSCHRFRMRCKSILMRADNIPVKEISSFVGYGPLAIYRWFKQYREKDLDGLREKGGRGVKPMMDMSDKEAVEKAVRAHRLSIKTAKAEWEKSAGKEVSGITFRRFLRVLAQDISV